MSPRSSEYLARAREHLLVLRSAEPLPPLLSLAYYACFQAATAVLSEDDCFASTHAGLWHLFHEHAVAPGRFTADLRDAARRLERRRLDVDYRAAAVDRAEVLAAIEVAERFVAEAERLIA